MVEETVARWEEVRGGGENGELGPGHALEIAHDAATEEAEELDSMLERHAVGVAEDDHRGGGDAADVVIGP